MKQRQQFIFKNRDFLSGSRLLGCIFIFAGVFALLSPVLFEIDVSAQRVFLVGGVTILIGYVAAFSYSGTKIDFARSKFREYQVIAGFTTGEWQKLPPITAVKVISRTYMQRNMPNGISPTMSGKVTDFYVLLLANHPEPVLSFIYTSEKKAVKGAKLLATCMNTELHLLTSEEN